VGNCPSIQVTTCGDGQQNPEPVDNNIQKSRRNLITLCRRRPQASAAIFMRAAVRYLHPFGAAVAPFHPLFAHHVYDCALSRSQVRGDLFATKSDAAEIARPCGVIGTYPAIIALCGSGRRACMNVYLPLREVGTIINRGRAPMHVMSGYTDAASSPGASAAPSMATLSPPALIILMGIRVNAALEQ
jgi:hypothetical protein